MKNKKIVWIVIGIVSVVLIALAITYAYWQITKTQQGVNEITTACLDITLVDAESGNTGVTLQDQYPLNDAEGATLKPYKFTVTNNCDTAVDYQIALESTGSSTDALKASSLKVMLDETTSLLNANETVTPTIDGAYASHKLGMGTLAASGNTGSSATHELRLWIDEIAPVSENNRTYNGKITVTVGQGIKAPVLKKGSLAYTLVNAYGGEAAITELDSSAFATATTADDAGMYKAMDDYGDSYYYRGNVTNNYVKFGEWKNSTTINFMDRNTWEDKTVEIAAGSPMYWRVVRVNGDGTVRMIYAGTSKVSDEASNYLGIGQSQYDTHYSTNKMYAGYMLGTESDPYGDSDSTILTDSRIKSTIDTWYTNNLKENYETYLADSIFCNDKEEHTVDEYDAIIYKANQRISTFFEPTLTCSIQRDRFTVNDTTLGNGRLTNPIGLLTADEASMAGYSTKNTSVSNYLDNITAYWTGTIKTYSPDTPSGYNYALSNNKLGSFMNNDYDQTVRPVINLKADVGFTIDEDGTYVITTN